MKNLNPENKKISYLEIEKKTLAILINSAQERHDALLRLKVYDFGDERNKLIFSAIKELTETKHDKFDLDVLLNHLEGKGIASKAGGIFYLSEIVKMYTSDGFLSKYIEVLIEKSTKLHIINQIKNWTDLTEDKNDSHFLWENLHKGIAKLEPFIFREQKNLISIHHVIDKHLKKFKQISAGNQEIICSTGFANLDNLTSGFQKGDLIVLAARPSMGKTALALKMALESAFKSEVVKQEEKGDVIIFSLEMSENQLSQRLIYSHIPNFNFTHSQENNFVDVEKFRDQLSKSDIFIDNSTSIDVYGIQLKLRSWAKKRKIKLVIIDYLQLLKPVLGRFSENRNLEVSLWTRKLKEIARDLEIPILCLSQLSRLVERREDKRPLLSDLRDSGSIEQDADLVLFLYRESYYQKRDLKNDNQPTISTDANLPHPTELIIAKHRNGPTGIVKLIFHPRTVTFYEEAEYHE